MVGGRSQVPALLDPASSTAGTSITYAYGIWRFSPVASLHCNHYKYLSHTLWQASFKTGIIIGVKNYTLFIVTNNPITESVEIPTRFSFVIEFITPKFFEGSTSFERHTAQHQEPQTVFAASGFYAHMVTDHCQGWVGTQCPLSLGNGRSPYGHKNRRLQIHIKKSVYFSDGFDTHGSVHRRWLSRNTNKMQLCNRIYYSKVFWRLNIFRAAHRSSSGAPNCICSLWVLCP